MGKGGGEKCHVPNHYTRERGREKGRRRRREEGREGEGDAGKVRQLEGNFSVHRTKLHCDSPLPRATPVRARIN